MYAISILNLRRVICSESLCRRLNERVRHDLARARHDFRGQLVLYHKLELLLLNAVPYGFFVDLRLLHLSDSNRRLLLRLNSEKRHLIN